MARRLGVGTMAEGVETAQQAEMLRALKCDKGQGYFYARAPDACAATNWLAAQVPAAGLPTLMLLATEGCDGAGRRTRRGHREAASAALSLQPTDVPASRSSP